MNKLTPEEAILALSKCKQLEETIDRLKIRLMKAARPKLELVKDERPGLGNYSDSMVRLGFRSGSSTDE